LASFQKQVGIKPEERTFVNHSCGRNLRWIPAPPSRRIIRSTDPPTNPLSADNRPKHRRAATAHSGKKLRRGDVRSSRYRTSRAHLTI